MLISFALELGLYISWEERNILSPLSVSQLISDPRYIISCQVLTSRAAIVIIFVFVLVSPGNETSLFISARDGVVKEETKEASNKHAGLQQHPEDLIKLLVASQLEPGVLLDPLRQGQGEEERETKDKEVPGGVEIYELKVGQTHSCYHSKHDTEDTTNNGTGDGQEQGT